MAKVKFKLKFRILQKFNQRLTISLIRSKLRCIFHLYVSVNFNTKQQQYLFHIKICYYSCKLTNINSASQINGHNASDSYANKFLFFAAPQAYNRRLEEHTDICM